MIRTLSRRSLRTVIRNAKVFVVYSFRFLQLLATKRVSVVRFRSPFVLKIEPYGNFSGSAAHIIRTAIEMNSKNYWSNVACQGETVVDIGAYTGDTARYFMWRGARRVYCFEPHRYLFEEAKHNVAGFSEVVLRNVAIGSRDGTAVLGGILMGLFLGAKSGQRVQVVSFRSAIGEILEREGRIGLLKLDCEGCEWEVFKEENADIFERIDAVAVEVHGDDKDPKEIIAYLEKKKFKLVHYPPYYFQRVKSDSNAAIPK